MALIDNIERYFKCYDNEANTTVTDATSTQNGTASTNTSNLFSNGTGILQDSFDFTAASTEYFLEDTLKSIFDVTADYSVNMWVAPDLDQNQVFVSSRNGSNSNRMQFMLRLGEIRARSIGGSDVSAGGTWTGGTSGTNVMITLVHHSDNSMEVYVNNTLVTGGVTAIGPGATDGTAFGATRQLNDNWYDGNMSEIGVWSKLLSSQDRIDLYNSGNGLAYPFTGVDLRNAIRMGSNF